jgi:hypothetical protein
VSWLVDIAWLFAILRTIKRVNELNSRVAEMRNVSRGHGQFVLPGGCGNQAVFDWHCAAIAFQIG